MVACTAEFQAAIDDFQQRVDAEARPFVGRQLPHLYEPVTHGRCRGRG
ncbi:hypothetical protein [Streptomyces sp. MI02-7b]